MKNNDEVKQQGTDYKTHIEQQLAIIDNLLAPIDEDPDAAPVPESEVSDELPKHWIRQEGVILPVAQPASFPTPPASTGAEELLACRLSSDHYVYLSVSGVPDMPKFYAVVCSGCCSTAYSESRERVVEIWNRLQSAPDGTIVHRLCGMLLNRANAAHVACNHEYTWERCLYGVCVKARELIEAAKHATPTPSPDTEKEARQAFEDIAHLARERVNIAASEVYALLEHIDRRVSAALADLSSRSEQSDDKGDRG